MELALGGLHDNGPGRVAGEIKLWRFQRLLLRCLLLCLRLCLLFLFCALLCLLLVLLRLLLRCLLRPSLRRRVRSLLCRYGGVGLLRLYGGLSPGCHGIEGEENNERSNYPAHCIAPKPPGGFQGSYFPDSRPQLRSGAACIAHAAPDEIDAYGSIQFAALESAIVGVRTMAMSHPHCE